MYKNRESGRNMPKQRLYTQQQVIKLYQRQLQPKLSNIFKQLQEKQHTIRELNEIINQNDIRINHQSKIIEGLKQRINNKDDYISQINQNKLNEKQLNAKFQAFSKQLGLMLNNIKQVMNRKSERLAVQTVNALKDIQNNVSNSIQHYKNRSNKYWQNIKTTLTKMYEKINENQQKILKIQNSLDNFTKSYMMSGEIQKCKRFLVRFSEIKSSINTIQQHYKQLLSLQKNKNKKDSTSLIDLQYSREESLEKNNSYYKVKNQLLSPVKPIQYKDPQNLQKKNKSNSQKRFSENSMLSLTPSNLMHTTALINLSMQTRRSMIQSCRERLLQLIQLKKIQKPLPCYLDQINYLKNAQNNYIFDSKGNMFKMNKQNFKTLQKEGIVKQCSMTVPVSHIA